MTPVYSRPPYSLGTHLALGKERQDNLICLLNKTPRISDTILAGRIKPVKAKIPGIGAVIIKHYRRGGIIRHFIKDRYLRGGKPRSQREYEMLETVRALGVSSPEPIVWAVRGHILYRAFLITRMIERSRSLSDIGKNDMALSRSAIEKTAGNINLLLKNRIFHVDLHPGNVLVDEEGQVHIIDFDKARLVAWNREKLYAAYINRWKRAVKKYSFPAFMTDRLIEDLNTS